MAKVPAKYWHTISNGDVQCDLCPRQCVIAEGQRGFCYIRGCEDGKLLFYGHGVVSGIAIDPIEKKPLYHFLPGSKTLSIGSIGCNLACHFCQNSGISRAHDMRLLSSDISPDELVDKAISLGVESIAFTYNEPIVFMEYIKEISTLARCRGIKTIAVTGGYILHEARDEFFSFFDAANVDLKSFDGGFYKKYCNGDLDVILDTLSYIKNKTDVWLEITNLVIPSLNDHEHEIISLSQWLVRNLGANVPLHFTAFHPSWKMLDLRATPVDSLLRAREIAKKNGLNYVYSGNILNSESSCTYCTNCGIKVIERKGLIVEKIMLNSRGQCPKCGVKCVGVFNIK